jgi:hypothetical protein
VFWGEWCIGRIYETRTGPESLRWFWALHAPSKLGTPRTEDRATTLNDQRQHDQPENVTGNIGIKRPVETSQVSLLARLSGCLFQHDRSSLYRLITV